MKEKENKYFTIPGLKQQNRGKKSNNVHPNLSLACLQDCCVCSVLRSHYAEGVDERMWKKAPRGSSGALLSWAFRLTQTTASLSNEPIY